MDFLSMVSERILENYPEELQENYLEKIGRLKELQKAKYRGGKLNEKILSSIVKLEEELWREIREYQKDNFAKDVLIDDLNLNKNKFFGFESPWEFIGIENKLFSYIKSHDDLIFEEEKKFACKKCFNDPEEVTVFHLKVYDKEKKKPRFDWQRGVIKQRKQFKKGIYIYYCSTCKKWGISSNKYNPYG